MSESIQDRGYALANCIQDPEADLVREMADRIDKLEAENARLREPLKFYADPANHERGIVQAMPPIFFDQGQRAREALEKQI